ncbi:MAG: type II toxin-antitoxin system RelE/ParE family toxin [Oscillospiraceae bacterium]|nr:type II toxin-antitoxin system RelE/ParE family toxin [Oscillospiraceae bacterium]
MVYKLHKDAEKYLSKLNSKQILRILTAIKNLPNGDVKRLKGREPEMRLRIGNFRVVFEVRENIFYVLEIGSRGDVYKCLN